ncbi:hypothetical protein EI534_23730 [Pseudomonas frederiksbergensis]|nr:hypothetical protein [Pseudomonas frederiksbergensis]
MKALVENNASDRKSIKTSRKRPSMELPESHLRRIKEALANPVVEEPVGVLAGASLTLSS